MTDWKERIQDTRAGSVPSKPEDPNAHAIKDMEIKQEMQRVISAVGLEQLMLDYKRQVWGGLGELKVIKNTFPVEPTLDKVSCIGDLTNNNSSLPTFSVVSSGSYGRSYYRPDPSEFSGNSSSYRQDRVQFQLAWKYSFPKEERDYIEKQKFGRYSTTETFVYEDTGGSRSWEEKRFGSHKVTVGYNSRLAWEDKSIYAYLTISRYEALKKNPRHHVGFSYYQLGGFFGRPDFLLRADNLSPDIIADAREYSEMILAKQAIQLEDRGELPHQIQRKVQQEEQRIRILVMGNPHVSS